MKVVDVRLLNDAVSGCLCTCAEGKRCVQGFIRRLGETHMKTRSRGMDCFDCARPVFVGELKVAKIL